MQHALKIFRHILFSLLVLRDNLKTTYFHIT